MSERAVDEAVDEAGGEAGENPQSDDDEIKQQFAPGSPTEEKKYRLRGCSMKVVSCGKRDKSDDHMIIDLEFKFPQQPAKFVELPYTPEGMKNSLMLCNNALDTVVLLEDLNYKDSKKYFDDFIHQEIEKFLQKEGGHDGSRKPKIIAHKPTIEKIGHQFYFISSDIYLISGEVKKLNQEEIEELPVLISWEGPNTAYETNPEECMKLLVKIIRNFNLLQNRRFASFPLAVFVAHIAGRFYDHIVREQGNYALQMFISGDVHGTGKSLMRTLMMLILLGELRAPTRTLTEHTFYEMLNSGDSIYVNEFVLKSAPRRNEVDAKFLGFAVQSLWEMSEKRSKGKVYAPKGVMHVDANITPKQLEPYLTKATMSKLFFNHTGPIPLKHPRKKEIIDEMKEDAQKLHQYLPDLLFMGVSLVVPVASDHEAAQIDHLLKSSGDPREAQRIIIYDRVHGFLRRAIEEYNLDKPILFETDDIDRTSLLYCNVEEEELLQYEALTQEALEICENHVTIDLIEEATARGTYKVDIDNEIFPPRLKKDFKKIITPSHTFFKGSKNKKRVIMLSEAFLSDDTAQRLKDESSRYSLWSRPLAVREEFNVMNYGNKFYSRVEKNRQNDEMDAMDCHLNLDEEDGLQSTSQKRKLGKQETSSSAGGDREGYTKSETDEDDGKTSPRKKIHTVEEAKSEETSKFTCKKPSCRDFGKSFKSEKDLTKHEGYKYHKEK